MLLEHQTTPLPSYHGHHWLPEGLPTQHENWLSEQHPPITDPKVIGIVDSHHLHNHYALSQVVEHAVSYSPWQWPSRPIYFVSDAHADADAFTDSLVASGGVHKTGPGYQDIELTEAGRYGVFVIGGDCLDKGPSNLDLLRSIRTLMNKGAIVKLLAGNHDVRLLMGLHAFARKRHPTTEHLFLRMGPKVVPLLKEIHTQYLVGHNHRRHIPDKQTCRRELFPSEAWFEEFPKTANWLMPEHAIERELKRMQKKLKQFERACSEAGMCIRDVYNTAHKARELFLKPKGELSWFFRDMQLLHRAGSFLFIHAGLCDQVTQMMEKRSLEYLNRQFRKQVKQKPFEFYYGPLANTMRTKYREVDMPLTELGIQRAYRQGIHAIVHGHQSRTNGQNIKLRQGMIHIEGDITLDRNSRRKEGLAHHGAGVTIIRPEGQVIGISTDYPYAKVFQPEKYMNNQASSAYATK